MQRTNHFVFTTAATIVLERLLLRSPTHVVTDIKSAEARTVCAATARGVATHQLGEREDMLYDEGREVAVDDVAVTQHLQELVAVHAVGAVVHTRDLLAVVPARCTSEVRTHARR